MVQLLSSLTDAAEIANSTMLVFKISDVSLNTSTKKDLGGEPGTRTEGTYATFLHLVLLFV